MRRWRELRRRHTDRQERVLGAVIGFLGVCVTRQKGFQGIFVRCASNSQIYVSKKKCVRNTGFGEKFNRERIYFTHVLFLKIYIRTGGCGEKLRTSQLNLHIGLWNFYSHFLHQILASCARAGKINHGNQFSLSWTMVTFLVN